MVPSRATIPASWATRTSAGRNRPSWISAATSSCGTGELSLTADWYHKKTSDLLLDRPTAPSTGFTSFTDNIGAMSNKGLELSVTAVPIQPSRAEGFRAGDVVQHLNQPEPGDQAVPEPAHPRRPVRHQPDRGGPAPRRLLHPPVPRGRPRHRRRDLQGCQRRRQHHHRRQDDCRQPVAGLPRWVHEHDFVEAL